MMVERWNPEEHLALFQAWSVARGMPPEMGPAGLFPATGVVADRCAIAFMYYTNAPAIAYLDNLMTDPHIDRERRVIAVGLAFNSLCSDAYVAGVRFISAVTKSPLVRQALVDIGFRAAESGMTWYIRRED